MKNKLTRQIVDIILLVSGLVLMTGGIKNGKHGATVIGFIVAAVSVQQWIQWNKKENNNKKNIIFGYRVHRLKVINVGYNKWRFLEYT